MLDVRVKERLTGAIILVALLVLLVPELLTGRGHTASSGQAPANSEAGQTRSYTIDLGDGSASKPVTAPTTSSGETPAAATPDSQTNAASSPADAGSAAVPPESDLAASAEPERPVPAPRPGDKPQAARADASKVAPTGRDDAPTAQAPVPRAEAAKSASSAARGEAPKPATARVESPKATPPTSASKAPVAAGAPAETVKPPTRVASADAAKATSASRASSPEAKPASGWAVQVGSFASRENAERLTRELKGKGFAATVSESSGKGKRLWRVRVGPEGDRAAAVALGAKLRSAGHSGGSVVPYP